MVNKHMKRCSVSLVIREMQIRSTLRYYFTAILMAMTKKMEYYWNSCTLPRGI
jgi:hypothetical protein